MKTLLGKRLLPIVSMSALLVLGNAACDEGSDDEDEFGGKAGSSGQSDAGKGGSGGSKSNDEGGKGGSGGAGGSKSSDEGGKGGSGGAGGSSGADKKCDPTEGEVVNVDKNISEDTTWECGTYLLQDLIYVTDNKTLTIKPGALILGDTDTVGKVKALIITRGAKIDAVGTKADPIVFSSGNEKGNRTPGDWGGVVLLGKASVNKGNCIDGTGDTCSGGYFQGNVEGLSPDDKNALYGGKEDDSDCGHLEYARIEFAGYQLSPDNELNGLTVGACGSKTKISHLQVHRGSDDGIEFFGGTAGIDHVLISGPSDDGLDWDLGWRGKAQFVIIHQAPNDGDKGIEADNQGENEIAEPRSKPELWNFTLVGGADKTAALLREGTRGVLRNFLIADFGIGIDIAAKLAKPDEDWPGELSIESSVFSKVKEAGDPDEMDDDMNFNENDAIKASDRKNAFDVDAKLGSTDLSKPNYKPGNKDVGGRATPGGDFTKASYAGAIDPEGDDWTAGWTDFSKD